MSSLSTVENWAWLLPTKESLASPSNREKEQIYDQSNLKLQKSFIERYSRVQKRCLECAYKTK